jgi:hypothetical protein
MAKTSPKPFGLAFLEEVPMSQLKKLNGGRHHKKHVGPTLTTEHVSMPQPAFPQGDHG